MLIISVAFLALAIGLLSSAFEEVRQKSPLQFQEPVIARTAFATLVWGKNVSNKARYKYLSAHAAFVLFGLCTSSFLYSQNNMIGALAFLAISLATAALTLKHAWNFLIK